ncbi:gamma-aminobutyric acid receptor alpha-like [Mytilus galloprovincialis]|uniref:gamma-aminobutyric acid receptor alpha-like n=1 Tax=Mytilus galloprovincialis TaxID=29158 RepID=UPI003F7CB8E9
MGTDSYKSNVSIVLDEILSTYDKDLRPSFGGNPVEVLTDIYLRSMGPISEKDMVYSIDIYFRQRWMDERLATNSSTEKENISVSIKILEKIWFPDTVFYNGRKSYLHMVPTPNRFVRIGRNGSIYFSQRLTVRAICKMELHHYPLDFQTCPLYFGSFAYSEDDVKYTWNSGKDASVARAPDMTMSQFDLINFSAETSFTYRKDGDLQSMLTVYFNLRRHTGYFVINIFVPCMLLVILSWVSFWINREATSDRIALGTTTVLTMAFLALDSRSDLPRVKYATALDLYIALCFVFILSAIVQFAIVHRFTKHGHGDVEPSPTDNDDEDEETEDETVYTGNGKPHNQSFHPDTNIPSNRVFLCRGESRLRVWLSSLRIKNRRQFKRRKHRNSVSQIDRVSRVLFPLVFILLNFLYWSFYLK